jgi:6-phosphogluconolactonase
MTSDKNDDTNEKIFAYVGSWGVDSPDAKSSKSGGGGIHLCLLDLEHGSLKALEHVSKDINVGMICLSPDGKYLYCTDERSNWEGRPAAGGGVHAFAVDAVTGSLRTIDGTASMGVYPCHITVDSSGMYVFVSNHGEPSHRVTKVVPDAEDRFRVETQYDDGVVAVYPIRRDGGLGHVCDVKILTGRSIDPLEQASAHPHSVNIDPENKFAFVCDKGSDRIITYRVERATGTLEFVSSLATVPGAGPRHLAFHPSLPYFFTSNEINSTVSSYEFDPQTGAVAFVQEASTLPHG